LGGVSTSGGLRVAALVFFVEVLLRMVYLRLL
jgi:hypothetical protein